QAVRCPHGQGVRLALPVAAAQGRERGDAVRACAAVQVESDPTEGAASDADVVTGRPQPPNEIEIRIAEAPAPPARAGGSAGLSRPRLGGRPGRLPWISRMGYLARMTMRYRIDEGLPPLAAPDASGTERNRAIVARMVARHGAPSLEDY